MASRNVLTLQSFWSYFRHPDKPTPNKLKNEKKSGVRNPKVTYCLVHPENADKTFGTKIPATRGTKIPKLAGGIKKGKYH